MRTDIVAEEHFGVVPLLRRAIAYQKQRENLLARIRACWALQGTCGPREQAARDAILSAELLELERVLETYQRAGRVGYKTERAKILAALPPTRALRRSVR